MRQNFINTIQALLIFTILFFNVTKMINCFITPFLTARPVDTSRHCQTKKSREDATVILVYFDYCVVFNDELQIILKIITDV